jgi:TonB-dependent SusC/RagA subfamily outer membrane receptor
LPKNIVVYSQPYFKSIQYDEKNFSNPTKKIFAFLAMPTIALCLMAFSEKVYIKQDLLNESHLIMKTTEDSVVIRIRGVSETPLLIVVDGKEMTNTGDIKPDDIESISVLKDNSATEIYGKKGENGVILITTKRK